MTEPTNTATDAAAPVDVEQPATDDTTTDVEETSTEDADKTTKANREAARYRRQLREAEANLETLTERLAVVQRGEAERIAAEHLADGADLWRDGATIDSLLDDDGNVDPAKVGELAAATAAAHPHWIRPPQPKAIRRGALASGATNSGEQSTPTWSNVLRRHNG